MVVNGADRVESIGRLEPGERSHVFDQPCIIVSRVT